LLRERWLWAWADPSGLVVVPPGLVVVPPGDDVEVPGDEPVPERFGM
jgi:hypothetical protein